MVRYFFIATIVVVLIVAAATAWHVGSDAVTQPSAPPSPTHYDPAPTPHGGFDAPSGHGDGALHGDAPWALSALPDCLIQRSEVTGPLAYVRSKIPAGAAAIAPGTVLTYGPCTISVRDGEAVVSRGTDVLRIPPRVTLYRAAQRLALLRTSGDHGELRIYSPPQTSQ